MKKLQESLLDDEDILLNDTHKAAEIMKAMQIIDKVENFSCSTKPDEDMFGRKLNRGDIVICSDTSGLISFYMVHSVNTKTRSCLLVFRKDDFYEENLDWIPQIPCEDLIKIDLKILEQIMKVK